MELEGAQCKHDWSRAERHIGRHAVRRRKQQPALVERVDVTLRAEAVAEVKRGRARAEPAHACTERRMLASSQLGITPLSMADSTET